MADREEPRLLDLDRFASREDALRQIHRERGFDDVVFEPLQVALARNGGGISMLGMFTLSSIARVRGLHEGIVREIGADNPHAVFPLLRAFAEALLLIAYVADHPEYVEAAVQDPRDDTADTPKRKTFQGLINHMDSNYSSQFKHVYAELSDLAHFGSRAVWNAWQPVDEETRSATWTSTPRWRDQRDLYIACASLLELSAEMEIVLKRLVDRL